MNYRRADLTVACLDSLKLVEWPKACLEVVVVDNGSSDGSADVIKRAHPWVRTIDSGENLGFAGGNNLALRSLDGVGYVALLNNDTTVEPGWLAPLVAALEHDDGAGAACSKVLFAGQFLEVTLTVPGARARSGDRRPVGVRLSGIEVDGVDQWASTQFVEGWWGPEFDRAGRHPYQWSAGSARLRLPAGRRARIRLAADGDVGATLEGGGDPMTVTAGRHPAWVTVPLGGDPVDIVNNVGNRLLSLGFGADRGYQEVDRGQYQLAAEVFGWCGASALLRPEYLRDIGLFDERLFLYYEDLDLSWRGRARGWRYVYVPGSVVRHIHSATVGQGSRLAAYYQERNRLLVSAKNAPWPLSVRAVFRFVLVSASYLRRDVWGPLVRGHRPRLTVPIQRVRAFAGYLRLLPAMIVTRRTLRRAQTVPDEDLLAWTAR